MEAHSKESQDLKMDPEVNIRKPLRARKTMTPTSRKQVEILKSLHGLGRAGSGAYSVDNFVRLKMIEREHANYSNKETNPDPSKKLSAKEPVAKLVVNSEINIYDSSPDVSRDDHDSNADSSVSLQDLLLSLYEKESNSPVSKPVEVHLFSKRTIQPSGSPEERTSSPSSDVPPSGITEKKEETPENPAAALLKQLHDNFEFRKGESRSDSSWRKRRTSEREEDVSCKQVTSSVETGEASSTQSEKSQSRMEKVRCLVQSRVDSSLGDLDRRLQELNQRIEHTQCLRKHEGITIRIIKKISRLDRHVNSALEFQRAHLSKKKSFSTERTVRGCQISAPEEKEHTVAATLGIGSLQASLPSEKEKTTILNVSRPLSGNPNDPSVPSKRRSAQPGEVPSKTVRSSVKETSLAVENSSVQGRNSTVSTDAQQKSASSDAHSSAEASCAPKNKILIDLTEEEETNPAKEEVSVKANPPPESTTPKTPQPTTEPPAEFPHLPPLPENCLDPPHMTLKDTLPPQKLELEVVHVRSPKGIALQWNIREVDPRCAPIDSYHLFICHEHKGTRSPWTKTNEISALPLPMAIRISQVATSGTCYFAMQSRDIFGRFGPLCDIKSISAV